jgi:recombination protein RecA
MKRKKFINPGSREASSKSTQQEGASSFFTSGCRLLDCVLGKGWPQGKVINVIGDSSSGKTLLAIEAAHNFLQKYKNSRVWFDDVEGTFDINYAEALGLALKKVEITSDCFTVEELVTHVEKCLDNKFDHGLYILDSLDALSDQSELDRDINATNTFGTQKARKLSEFFRRLNKKLSKSNVTFLVISQVRANIGVTFGQRYTRSGGKSLDFYASLIVWLSQVKKLRQTKKGIARIIGILIKAHVTKNKVADAFRDCTFPIRFGFGLDDVEAHLEWLELVKTISKKERQEYSKKGRLADTSEYKELRKELGKMVKSRWDEIEESFAPNKKKY